MLNLQTICPPGHGEGLWGLSILKSNLPWASCGQRARGRVASVCMIQKEPLGRLPTSPDIRIGKNSRVKREEVGPSESRNLALNDLKKGSLKNGRGHHPEDAPKRRVTLRSPPAQASGQ